MAGAGVLYAVDAVAEAVDLFAMLALAGDERLGVLRLTDLLGQMHHGLGGAAVAGALEGADGGDDGSVHVGQGGGGDAGGEGGGVGAVLDVKDEVNVYGACRLGIRSLAVQHVQEVGGQREVRVRRYGLVAAADAVVGGDDGRHLGGEAHSLAQVRLSRHIIDVGVEGGEGANGGAQDVHRVGGADLADDLDDGVRNGTGVS